MRFILVSDGSSDKALLPIIKNLLSIQFPNKEIFGERADFSRIRKPPKKLEEKIEKAVDLYEIDTVFVHRDAEKFSIEKRDKEIGEAIRKLNSTLLNKGRFIKVIPVRMTEAWLLIEPAAIKKAAGNPNSSKSLKLPDLKKIEQIPDPKKLLRSFIKEASGLSGRRLNNLNIQLCISLIAENIRDFSPLNNLKGYKHLKEQIKMTFINDRER